MRSVAAAGFVALGFGCNAILGLDSTSLQPDAPPPQPPRILITHQALTGVAPDVIGYLPLETVDKVKLAPMGVAFVDHSCSEQAPPCTQSFDGVGFPIPDSLVGQKYRIQYQPLGDPIPHEVQWDFTAPHICAPYFGKPDQAAAPSNATIEITATGGPTTFDTPMVFTYGTTWSAGVLQTSGPNPIDYSFTASATPVQPPLTAIQKKTDSGVIVDFDNSMNPATCPVPCVKGGARFNTDVQPFTTVSTAGPWQMPALQSVLFKKDSGAWFGRYVSAIGSLAGVQDTTPTVFAGVIPSTTMPPFAIVPFANKLDPLTIPMFTLAAVPETSEKATFANPFTDDNLPLAIAFQITQLRHDMQARWPDLYFGFQWIRLADQTDMTTTLDHQDVGIPGNPMLAGTSLKEMDDAMVDLANATMTALTFKLDKNADDCTATLYQANATTWAALRSYEVMPGANLDVSIQIDTSVFQPATRYVFGIECRIGLPNAPSMGQFDQISYPFAVSSTHPAVFEIQP